MKLAATAHPVLANAVRISFPNDQVQIPQGVVTRIVDGATLLLNADTGRYFSLDDVGSRAWMLLTSCASIQVAYEMLLAEYEVEPAQLRRDLETLILALVERGLVDVRHA